MDDASHVRSAEAELAGSVTWLRDEEARVNLGLTGFLLAAQRLDHHS
jgi:hypothetical protein